MSKPFKEEILHSPSAAIRAGTYRQGEKQAQHYSCNLTQAIASQKSTCTQAGSSDFLAVGFRAVFEINYTSKSYTESSYVLRAAWRELHGGEQSDNLTAKLEQKDEQASQHDKPREEMAVQKPPVKSKSEESISLALGLFSATRVHSDHASLHL